MFRFYFLLLVSIFCISFSFAQRVTISGIVEDAHTNEPISYASVYMATSHRGQTTDSAGRFSFSFNKGDIDTLVISYVGFETRGILTADLIVDSVFHIQLDRRGINEGVVVRTKKFNKGLFLWKKIMSKKYLSNRLELSNYQYEAYNKLEIDLKYLNADKAKKNILLKPFSFIFKTITALSNEDSCLPAYLIESISDYSYQRNPKRTYEHIKAINTTGLVNTSVDNLVGVMNQNVEVFSNFISIVDKDFISPFNDNADRYYTFSVPDTQMENGHKLFHFLFTPKQAGTNTFEGEAWVIGQIFQLKNITLFLGKNANINYINRISIFQEFAPINDSMNFLRRDKFFADFKLTGNNSPTLVGRKATSYKNIIINSDSVTALLKNQTVESVTESDKGFEKIGDSLWGKLRHDTLSAKDLANYKIIDKIIHDPKYERLQKFLVLLASGYKDVGVFEIGQWYNLVSSNVYEGTRYRLDVGTNIHFSKNIHLHTYLAYGTTDMVFKGKAEAFWIVRRKKSDWLKLNAVYSNDIDQGISSNTGDVSQDNIFSFIIRKPGIERKFLQLKNMSFDVSNDWGKGFSTQLYLSHQQYTPLKNLPAKTDFPVSSGESLTNFEVALKLRFAYLEKFLENGYYRYSIGTKYPVIELSVARGIPNVMKSAYQYTKLLISIKDGYKLSPFGSISYKLSAGKIYGTLPFTFLENHLGNDLYYFNTNGYNLMRRFEYLGDKYASIYLEHQLGSGLFKYIPLTRKLKWRQFWNAKVLWSSLSAENNALNNSHLFFKTLNNSPYMEVGSGVDNIFKLFRIDFVWRVLPQPLPVEKASRFGVFGSFHLQF